VYRSIMGTCGRMAATGCLAIAIVTPALSEAIKRVDGPDLFADLKLYAGTTVMLTDALVTVTGDDKVVIRAGGVTFPVSLEDVSRGSLEFFLTHCRLGSWHQHCKGPLLVTPTGEIRMNSPVLKKICVAPSGIVWVGETGYGRCDR
jgi:hypothetical protein